MTGEVVVVDYGRGNIYSIAQALRHAGYEPKIGDAPDDIEKAGTIVVPGVGAFKDVMDSFRAKGMESALREAHAKRSAIIGVCVGLQLFAESSEEFGVHPGLGFLKGHVKRLPDGEARVPNIGWRRVEADVDALRRFDGRMFYFVHSYHFLVEGNGVGRATFAINGIRATAAVVAGHLCGTQFHPEKSGPDGPSFLAALIELARAGAARA